MDSEKVICSRCGQAYGRKAAGFQQSYSALYKGAGYLPICKTCVDSLYSDYLTQCGNSRDAVRQMCRKLDMYWSADVYNIVEKKNTSRTIMSTYIQRINTITYAGKSYDDTLREEDTLWAFSSDVDKKISEDVISLWGPGYTTTMYEELEQRRAYWMDHLPEGVELDIGTEAIIRQICSLEIDINRDRAMGKSVEKSIAAFNQLLGSANLKPVQRKQDDMDAALSETPLGVWLYRYENKRPLPEIDDDLKDVNGLRRYVFIWMGHLCKMLGLKNAYSQMYEDEIAKYRVAKPEYDGDDDEVFFSEIMSEELSDEGK